MVEEAKFPLRIVGSFLKSVPKFLSFPFAGVAKRLRARRDLYDAFWSWAHGQSEEVKLGAHALRPYVVPKILESDLDLKCGYDELKELQRSYVHRLPLGLRKRLDSLLEVLKRAVLKYGDPQDEMYGSTPKRVYESDAATKEIGTSITDFRDFCKGKLMGFIYRSLG